MAVHRRRQRLDSMLTAIVKYSVAGLLLGGLSACDSGPSSGSDSPLQSDPPVVSTTTSASTTTSSSTTTTIPTTTTTLLDPGDVLVSILSDPEFSASMTVTRSQRVVGGTIVQEGSALVSGADSMLDLERDYSGLEFTFVTGDGDLVGPQGRQRDESATIVVGGDAYTLDDERWVRYSPAVPDTTVGHVFSVLGNVEAFVEVGGDDQASQGLLLMRPVEPVEYDPSFWSIDRADVETFESDTVVAVDESGTPVEVRLTVVGLFGEGVSPAITETVYSISEVGTTETVSPPTNSWFSISSLDYTISVDEELEIPAPFDVDFPTGFFVFDQEPGLVVLDTVTTLERVHVFGGLGMPATDPDEIMEYFLGLWDFDLPPLESPEFSVFPSRIAAFDDDSLGVSVFAYTEVQHVDVDGFVFIGVLWTAPPGLDDGRARFESALETIRWLPTGCAYADPESGCSEPFAPGGSLGNGELQADTADALLLAASVRTELVAPAGAECADPNVIWTALVDGGDDNWVEEWYVNNCSIIEIYTVNFAYGPGGGILIMFDAEPRIPTES